jgi:hypothetical protein
MIYLFEDRKVRMQQSMDSKFIKEGILNCEKENAGFYLKSNYSDAKCILFHKSYTFSQKGLSSDFIRQLFLQMGIPVIYFSGGLNNNLSFKQGLLIGDANSGDMYKNLNLFIKDYKNHGKPNIPLLIYGKKYLLNSLLELQYIINLILFDKKSNDLLNTLEMDDIVSAIRPRINEPELKDFKISLIGWIENHMYEKRIKAADIKNYVQENINKY